MRQQYPLAGYNFRVDFLFSANAPQDAYFSEISGLNSKLTFESDDKDSNVGKKELGIYGGHLKPVSGRDFGPIELSRGLMTNVSALTNWFDISLYECKTFRLPVLITLLGENKTIEMSWMLYDAFPIELKVSGFNAQESKNVIETFVLNCAYFTRFSLY